MCSQLVYLTSVFDITTVQFFRLIIIKFITTFTLIFTRFKDNMFVGWCSREFYADDVAEFLNYCSELYFLACFFLEWGVFRQRCLRVLFYILQSVEASRVYFGPKQAMNLYGVGEWCYRATNRRRCYATVANSSCAYVNTTKTDKMAEANSHCTLFEGKSSYATGI